MSARAPYSLVPNGNIFCLIIFLYTFIFKTKFIILNNDLFYFVTHIHSLRNEHVEYIANMIVAEFLSEVSSIYIPPIKKKESVLKKSIPTRRKKISMWRNTYANNVHMQIKNSKIQ